MNLERNSAAMLDGVECQRVRVGTLADRELVSELLPSSKEESAISCLRCHNCGRKVWTSASGSFAAPGQARSEQSLPLRLDSGQVSSISSGWSAASLCSMAGSPLQNEPCPANRTHHAPACRPVLDAQYAANCGLVFSDDGKTVFCGMDCYWSATLDPKSIRIRIAHQNFKSRPLANEKAVREALVFRSQQRLQATTGDREINSGRRRLDASRLTEASQQHRTDVSKRMPWLAEPPGPCHEVGHDADFTTTAAAPTGMRRTIESATRPGDTQHAMYEHHAYFGGTFRRTVGIEPLRRYAWY